MPNISLALSGSGFRFSAFIGVMKALEEANYIITEVAGTSGGGIISSMIAYGLNSDELLIIAKNLPYGSFVSPNLGSLFSFTGWNDGGALENALGNVLGAATFLDLLIPCSIVSTDLTEQKSFVFNKQNTPNTDLVLADRCSSAVPFIFSYVDFNGHTMVDGGVSDDLPVNYLKSPTNIKLAVQLTETTIKQKPANLIDLASMVLDTILIATSNGYLNEPNVKTLNIITPHGMSFKTDMNANDVQMLYELGYNATKKELATW